MTIASGFAFGQAADSALRSKRGYLILPEGDEWALGISAQPFLNYVGNIFNSNGNSSPSFDYTTSPASAGLAIFGKKMIDANTAYRARFNFSSGSSINKQVIAMDELAPDANAPAFVDDWQKNNNTQLVISAGIEKRRGKSRVQGVYGGEVVIGYSAGKTKYQYGNHFSTDFNTPNTSNFGNNLVGAGRIAELKNGKSFLVGARGFVGVEYFIAPKISLGGEFGYLLSFRTNSKTYITTESWNGTANTVQKIKTERYDNNGLTSYGVGLDNLSASINLLFYF